MVMLRAGFVGTGVTVQSASLAGYHRVWSASMAEPTRLLARCGDTERIYIGEWSATHARSDEMARRVGNAPTFPGFGVLRIACLPPPCLENLRSTIQGHRDGHTTTHSPQSQATNCRPLCPWMADRPLMRAICQKERTPLPRTGWSGGHSIAGVVPTGVSRWMFRCLWHTSQGSRLVL